MSTRPLWREFLEGLAEGLVEEPKGARTTDTGTTDPFLPQPGPQAEFIRICGECDITVYGGAAGGGKSYGELIQPVKHVDNAKFGGVIFRRKLTDVTKEGGLWDESEGLYPLLGGKDNKTRLHWTFPSGAKISFGHLEHEKNKFDWQGSQLVFAGFDELTHFTKTMFFYILGRLRSMSGIKSYVMATTNPSSNWVFKLLAPWVDSKFQGRRAKPGEILHFEHTQNKIVWVPEKTKKSLSITFIPAKLEDNRILEEGNPGYRRFLEAQTEEDKRALLYGEWGVRPAHRVVSAFDESKHVTGRAKRAHWLPYVGGDFGLVNDAQVIGRRENLEDTSPLVITNECWKGVQRDYKDIADHIREMCDGRTPIDGAGGNRTGERGERESLRAQGIPMQEPDPLFLGPVTQYKNLNRLFNEGLLFIDESCEDLIEQLNNLERKLDKETGDPTDEFDDSDFHLLCALRYLATLIFPPAAEQGPNPMSLADRIGGVPRNR